MTLERGFRRIVIALSVFLMAAGVTFDAFTILPHTTVRVSLNDGRQETLVVQWISEAATRRELLARELSDRGVTVASTPLSKFRVTAPDGTVYNGVVAASRDEAIAKMRRCTAERRCREELAADSTIDVGATNRGIPVDLKDIKDVTVLRAERWWWTDSVGAKIAAGLIILLWIVFYGVRWIAHGFAGRDQRK